MTTDQGHRFSASQGHDIDGVGTIDHIQDSRSGSLDDDIDATRFLQAFQRHWFLMAVITIVFGGGGFVLATWTPTTYEASATLVVSTPRETTGLPRTAATARALLTNIGVVSAALRSTAFEGTMSAAEFVRRQLSIDEVPGGQFVRVRIRAPEPDLAAAVGRSLVTGAITQGARVDERAAARTGDQLKIQLDRAAERMADAGRRLLAHYVSSADAGVTSDAGSRLSEVLLSAEGGVFLHGGGAAPRPRPRSEQGRNLAATQSNQLERLSAGELELAKLRADYVVARRLYSDVGLRYEQARSEALSGGSLVQLVDPEIAAGTPLPRNRARKTLLGLVVGLLVGVALIIVWEAQHSVRRGFVR